MASALDTAIYQIKGLQNDARVHGLMGRPLWPMIVLRSPKGWTGPKMVDGLPVEGSFRSHQVPLSDPAVNAQHLSELETWMRSYRPEELFDKDGAFLKEWAELAPDGERRMGANPHANGGLLLRELLLPDFRDYAVVVPSPGKALASDTLTLGKFLRDIILANARERNFRIFGPDETLSNKLDAVFEASPRQWEGETLPTDHLGLGEQRPGRRTRSRNGLRRRRAHARNPGRGIHLAQASAGSPDPRGECGRPDEVAAP